MIVDFSSQFCTIKPVFFIECSRFHCELSTTVWSWGKWRTAIRTELAKYPSAPITAIQVYLGWPLCVREGGLRHDDIGGKAGACVAFAISAVTYHYLSRFLVRQVNGDFLGNEGMHTSGIRFDGDKVIIYAMLLQRQAPVKQIWVIVVEVTEFHKFSKDLNPWMQDNDVGAKDTCYCFAMGNLAIFRIWVEYARIVSTCLISSDKVPWAWSLWFKKPRKLW
jgi:hypothetical protein